MMRLSRSAVVVALALPVLFVVGCTVLALPPKTPTIERTEL